MTVGVLWEFFEFSGDYFLGMDMQKDTVINAIHTVNLDQTLSNTVVHVRDISDVIVVHSDGTQEALDLGGYLDVGIIDTMKDLLVNLVATELGVETGDILDFDLLYYRICLCEDRRKGNGCYSFHSESSAIQER